MPYAFSIGQLIFRVILILFDILVNYQTLVTKQAFFPGVSMDYVPFIVLFNAGMLLFIFFVDLITVGWRRIRTNYVVGEGLTDLHKHEL
jgi:hypothetical protein